MFIFTISDFFKPYLASNSSGKMASSKVFEHSSPMLNWNGLDTLPALRSHMIGGDDVWQPMPTSANLVRPSSFAVGSASGLAQYVYRLPAVASTSSLLWTNAGLAFHASSGSTPETIA